MRSDTAYSSYLHPVAIFQCDLKQIVSPFIESIVFVRGTPLLAL
jgi:hypothetical protein